jgi:hypothetical protein
MPAYIIVSLASGILFGIMDGLINANPAAQRLYKVYQPIARTSFNPVSGILIDLVFGFIMAGVFLLLHQSLPGATGLVKGLSFGMLVWFFRVAMYTATQWVMFKLPVRAILYTMVTGLIEMMILGVLYGLTLKPAA